MLTVMLATALAADPWVVVRVSDPDHPDAITRSATSAILLEPPTDGTPWEWEDLPATDGVITEGLRALNADTWHNERGLRGAGVKIAVFDPGFYGAGLHDDELGAFQSHDCFAHPSCSPPIESINPLWPWDAGVHGFGCAQIVHDIAPEAELHLVTVSSVTTLENAVEWAIREEMDLVSMSLSFFNRAFFDGTSDVDRLAERLYQHDVLLVTSAGNYADGHWRGPLVDGDRDGLMDFDGDNGLWVTLGQGNTRGGYLTWDQYGICGTTDLAAVLYHPDGRVLGRADDLQVPKEQVDDEGYRCKPLERFSGVIEHTGDYWLEVPIVGGSQANVMVDVLVPGGELVAPNPRGSIADPGNSPYVLTVGAVQAEGYLTNTIEPFSSWGPTHAGLDKPEIAGPDGLSVSVYGGQGFFGTSAAAPAVAATLALIMSEEPGITPFQARDRMLGWAFNPDVLTGALDPSWGHGKARLPVVDPDPGCGRRPLLAWLLIVPLWGLRRRR